MSRSDTRARVWSFIMYPESAVDNWLTRLEDEHVPAAVSPLHDIDAWTAADELDNPSHVAGTFKKEHYHVLVAFEGKKSFDQVNEISSNLGGTYPITVNSVRSYYRYLCHLDSCDKAKYSVNDIILLSGFNPQNFIDEQTEVFSLDMIAFLVEHPDMSFAGFVNFCTKYHPHDWLPVLMRQRTLFFNKLISSLNSHGGDYRV